MVKIVVPMVANWKVPRWPIVRNVRFAVPLTNGPFANKCPTVAQTSASQISVQYMSKLILVDRPTLLIRRASVDLLLAYIHCNFPTIATTNGGTTICATWELMLNNLKINYLHCSKRYAQN